MNVTADGIAYEISGVQPYPGPRPRYVVGVRFTLDGERRSAAWLMGGDTEGAAQSQVHEKMRALNLAEDYAQWKANECPVART